MLLQPMAVAGVLVAYGNATAYGTGYLGLRLPGEMLLPNLLGVGLLLWWAGRQPGLTAGDLGLRWAGASRSVGWGALAGGLAALPALLVFAFPVMLPAPISYRPVAGLELSAFLGKTLLELPVATALCEELAFRGVLQALFLRGLSPLGTIAATNTAFALWHLVVNYHTVSETNLAGTGLVPLALMGGLVGVFAGGIFFSVLRLRTRSLAGSVLAHWLVDALMVSAVYGMR